MHDKIEKLKKNVIFSFTDAQNKVQFQWMLNLMLKQINVFI